MRRSEEEYEKHKAKAVELVEEANMHVLGGDQVLGTALAAEA